jgi:hypothetical protein
LAQTAMGWLGWPPDVVLNANIAHLTLAIAGKVDFVKKTNPWGSGKDDEPEPGPANPALAAQQFLRFAKWHNSNLKGRKR